MFNFSQLNEIQILMFGLILMRMISFVVSSAIFSSTNISVMVKILFSITLTVIVFQTVATSEALLRLKELEENLIIMVGRELLIGISLGFVTRFFFFVIAMAGEIISISMGLGQAQMFNPMMGNMGNAIEQFYTIIATLIYLSINGHHYMIQGLVDSFSYAQVAQVTFQTTSFVEIVYKIQNYFIFAIKIAAPILVAMIIIQVGIAVLSRTVPQINVLVTASALTTLLGVLLVFISLPLLIMQMGGLVDLGTIDFFKFIKTF